MKASWLLGWYFDWKNRKQVQEDEDRESMERYYSGEADKEQRLLDRYHHDPYTDPFSFTYEGESAWHEFQRYARLDSDLSHARIQARIAPEKNLPEMERYFNTLVQRLQRQKWASLTEYIRE